MSIQEKWDSIIDDMKARLNISSSGRRKDIDGKPYPLFKRIQRDDGFGGGKVTYYVCTHSFYEKCPKGGCTEIEKEVYEYIVARQIPDQLFMCDVQSPLDGPANSLRDIGQITKEEQVNTGSFQYELFGHGCKFRSSDG